MKAPEQSISAGVEISLRIGQRVCHQDYKGQRVTGVIQGLTVCQERGLMVDVLLDVPIVIPAGNGFAATNIHHQHAPAHEFSPFDERDELISSVLAELRHAVRFFDQLTPDDVKRMRAVIAKATGAA